MRPLRTAVMVLVVVCLCTIWATLAVQACEVSPPIWLMSATRAGGPDSSAVSGATTVEASVRDDLEVDYVDFLLDGKVLGAVKDTPYKIAWNTAKHSDGKHTLQARVHLADGSSLVSTPVTVSVKNNTSDPGPAG